jgi:hypothetical protein
LGTLSANSKVYFLKGDFSHWWRLRENIYFQFTCLKVSFLSFQPLNTPAQFSAPEVGAGACKDKEFVLDLNMPFIA